MNTKFFCWELRHEKQKTCHTLWETEDNRQKPKTENSNLLPQCAQRKTAKNAIKAILCEPCVAFAIFAVKKKKMNDFWKPKTENSNLLPQSAQRITAKNATIKANLCEPCVAFAIFAVKKKKMNGFWKLKTFTGQPRMKWCGKCRLKKSPIKLRHCPIKMRHRPTRLKSCGAYWSKQG